MSNNNAESWPSLAKHFDAPEEYEGHFGWICGYSADAAFLNDAAERFTRLTSAQRAYQGRIFLAVFLDPGNSHISLTEAPGVAHLPLKDIADKPFRLLHAKVALLGFKHKEQHDQWNLRLIASTGNWTRQTLEESLDLVWCIEIKGSLPHKPSETVTQTCADIKAANDLLRWITDRFDTRLLQQKLEKRHCETGEAIKNVEQWITECINKAKGTPHFFDNRKTSLLDQLPKLIKDCSKAVRRNYLAMGSGFYEGASEKKSLPKIPGEIITKLKNEALLTRRPEVDLFVEPRACQAIATSVAALKENGINVWPAGQPACIFGDNGIPRGLHAKFLFSANHRDNSNEYSSAWVYLGSGNLTNPGFANRMGAERGNLEAGVVFAADGLYREERKGIDTARVITNLLPIQWSNKVESDQATLQPGAELETRENIYLAPPVAYLLWHECAEASQLRTTSDQTLPDDFEALSLQGVACKKVEAGFIWPESFQPRIVRCRWGDAGSQTADIPVIDSFGRIAATQMPRIDIEQACWQLVDFPMPPLGDGDGVENNDEDDKESPADTGSPKARPMSISPYPIRQMMELVESIAARQTVLSPSDWPLWCSRLEQTLIQAKDSEGVKAFQALGINPLSPLLQPCFRPTFAETAAVPEGKAYEETIACVEESWGVNQLRPIGEVA